MDRSKKSHKIVSVGSPHYSHDIKHQFVKRAHNKYQELDGLKRQLLEDLSSIVEISEGLALPEIDSEKISAAHTAHMKEGAHTVLSILLPVSLLWASEGAEKGFLYKGSLLPSLAGLQGNVDTFKASTLTLLEDVQKLNRHESNLRKLQEKLESRNTDEGFYKGLITGISSKREAAKTCIDELANTHSKCHVLLTASEATINCEYFHHFNKNDVVKYYKEIKAESPASETHQTVRELVNYLKGSDKNWIAIKELPPKSSCANEIDKLSIKETLLNRFTLFKSR